MPDPGLISYVCQLTLECLSWCRKGWHPERGGAAVLNSSPSLRRGTGAQGGREGLSAPSQGPCVCMEA